MIRLTIWHLDAIQSSRKSKIENPKWYDRQGLEPTPDACAESFSVMMSLQGGTLSPRPYRLMRRAVDAAYQRYQWYTLAVVAGLVASVGMVLVEIGIAAPWLQMIMTSLIVGVGFAGLIIVLSLFLENLQHSALEDNALEAGIAFLRAQNYDEAILEVIERRAERGNTAVQLRTILPIAVLTVITALSSIEHFVPERFAMLVLVMAGLLLLLILALIREVRRANTDVVILSALIEYRAEQKMHQPIPVAAAIGTPAAPSAAGVPQTPQP